jgi:pimeloyl-ACP methyl ester carboxylesterase
MTHTTTIETEQYQPTGFGSVSGVPDLPTGFAERFRSHIVDVDGVRLHAAIGGAGPAILLIGGWPQFWWEWRHVMTPLGERHTVIAVDPRGIGLSDRVLDGYDTETVAAELHRLMSVLGHQQFDLVGHDVGMWIAYAMAADDPAPVTSLVVIDAALPGISPSPSALPDSNREVDSSWHFLFNRLCAVNEELIAGHEKAYLDAQFLKKAATPTSIPRSTIDVYVRAQRQPHALRGSLGYYRALDETIAQNRTRAGSQLTMPVLAIGGAASRGEMVGADLDRVALNVSAISIPDCGHYVAEEAPQELLAAMSQFSSN